MTVWQHKLLISVKQGFSAAEHNQPAEVNWNHMQMKMPDYRDDLP